MIAKLALLLLLENYYYGGTFVGAVICSDGIVMAADSRTTFMGGDGKPFAYLDRMPKIFFARGAAVGISGLSSLEGELFSSFLKRNDYLLLRPVNEINFDFLLRMPFLNTGETTLISAGYIDGKPMICAKAPILPQECLSAGMISSKNSAALQQRLRALGRLPTTAEAAAALTAAIEEHAKTDLGVGGPVNIVKLTAAAPPQRSGAPPIDDGLTQACDLVQSLRAAIMPIGSPEELDRRLKAACP
jgi:hypothetical protein